MSLSVPSRVLSKVAHPTLTIEVERMRNWRTIQDVTLSDQDVTDEVLADLAAAAEQAGDKSFARVVASIQASRRGDFSKSIPKFSAAPEAILSYLRHNMIDGWVYRRQSDGYLHAFLVTNVKIITARDDGDYIAISLVNNGASRDGLGKVSTSVSLNPSDVTQKKVEDIFLAQGLFKETPDLKAEYEVVTEAYRTILTEGFSEQYHYSGVPATYEWGRDNGKRERAKVVHDVHPSQIPAMVTTAPSALVNESDEIGVAEVPISPVVRVFDLATHTFYWANTQDLTRYVYDKGLRDKLVLPPEQADLLDILTTDVETFTTDVIEGKSAGNVILCKGPAGVGKTLSAEVYSELIERPLYSIHSGSLGTDAESIRKNLESIFKRAKRWNAVLLLDEADVFVLERGDSIQQNAIVAEFLRTLEYFDGLMFMTTNRADSIDDAIISRCAAIINYETPTEAAARAIWTVQARNNGVELTEDLVTGLVHHLPKATGRDIKMLLRLMLRVSAKHEEPLSLDLARRCSMFRAVEFRETEV